MPYESTVLPLYKEERCVFDAVAMMERTVECSDEASSCGRHTKQSNAPDKSEECRDGQERHADRIQLVGRYAA